MTELLRVPVSLGPVVLFLLALLVLDSFKLVPLRLVVRSVLSGCVAALVCVLAIGALLDRVPLGHDALTRYVAPVLEELAKAAFVLFLIRTHRVGFLVDAAIHGFAVGTGFALVENVYFLRAMDAGILVWVVRGFGTAILHGCTMTLFAVISHGIVYRGALPGAVAYVPGLAVAIGLHSLYNHFVLPPLATAGVILVALPMLVVLVFRRSEAATRNWLGAGLDTDLEILESIESGRIRESPVGLYLVSLKERFPPEVVADMLCLLQVHHELAARAKGMLIAREAGLDVPVGPRVRAKFEELAYLEKSIGRTGRLALRPVLVSEGREAWQHRLLRP